MDVDRRRVLVVGAYFVDVASHIAHVSEELQSSREWDVDQRWIALGEHCLPAMADRTALVSPERVPKFTLLNRVMGALDPGRYAYVVVCDDDIRLPREFLDGYLRMVERYGLALAQPARTHGSYTDHHFVTQLLGIDARETRFVEIGPLFSMRDDALRILTPFDEASPMGWGYDFIWPVVMQRAGLRMGIVDAWPVAHDLRKPVSNYAHSVADDQMKALLGRHPHLEHREAFHIVRSFA